MLKDTNTSTFPVFPKGCINDISTPHTEQKELWKCVCVCFPISSLRLNLEIIQLRTIQLRNYDNRMGEKQDLLLISMFLFLP